MHRTYDMPLVDWISIGLHSKTLEQALQAIRTGKPLNIDVLNRKSNRKYMEKVLREEIFKQFSDKKRPKLETVLNAIDAGNNNAQRDYTVDIRARGNKFEVVDNGTGMDLEEILKFLIIPFSTEKTGLEEIGRFGVGFFSTFEYCLKEPKKAKIIVETGSKKENHKVKFYASGPNIKDLRIRIKRKGKRKGTKVLIKETEFGNRTVPEYLYKHLKGVPTYMARILQNRKPINDDSKNTWYSAPVELNAKGKKVTQKVGFRKEKECAIFLTSQGVLVKSFRTEQPGSTISFPPAVQVVEGRDEFKIDENYKKCFEAYFRAFEKYIKDQKENKGRIEEIIEFIPNLASVFDIKNLSDIPNIDNIKETLLPGKLYALTDQQFDYFKPFLGEEIEKKAFKVSNQACSYWRELYGSEKSVFNREIVIRDLMDSEEFRKRIETDPSFYPNLHLLGFETTPAEKYASGDWQRNWVKNLYSSIALVDGPKNAESQTLVVDDLLFININHPDVIGELDLRKVYSIISDYYMNHEVSIKSKKFKDFRQAELHIQNLSLLFYRNPPHPINSYVPKNKEKDQEIA